MTIKKQVFYLLLTCTLFTGCYIVGMNNNNNNNRKRKDNDNDQLKLELEEIVKKYKTTPMNNVNNNIQFNNNNNNTQPNNKTIIFIQCLRNLENESKEGKDISIRLNILRFLVEENPQLSELIEKFLSSFNK